MNRGRPTPRGWSQSARFRQIGREAIRQWNAGRARLPRCEATRKSDGCPCQQWPMANGRCHWHGGATPRGDQYHRAQPSRSVEKLDAKLQAAQRKQKQRAARLATMTPEQRARHDAWHRARAPGAAATRSARRERARQNADARAVLNVGPSQPVSDPELVRVETALAVAKAKLARFEAASVKPTDENEGVFA